MEETDNRKNVLPSSEIDGENAAKEAEETEDLGEEAKHIEEERKSLAPEKSGGGLRFFLSAVAFILFLAAIWMAPIGGDNRKEGIFYAKENNLYFYNGEDTPYLVHKNIGGTGSYHYFYYGWGADLSETGDWGYYRANVDEQGLFDLYCRDMKEQDEESQLIDSGVYGYGISRSGEDAAYIKVLGDGMELYRFDGEAVRFVSRVQFTDQCEAYISDDGTCLVYTDASGVLTAETIAGVPNKQKLTDSAVMYGLAEANNMLYFLVEEEAGYDLYGYDFKEKEAKRLAENVSYMQIMPNNKDVLYAVKPTDVIPYGELIIDDIAEADAVLKEGEEGYEAKLQRDKIREAVKAGEGIQPMMMEYYLYSDGESVLLKDHVVSAVALEREENMVAGYKSRDFEPIPLSLISGGPEMVEMIYYMFLNYGGVEAFLTDCGGNFAVLDGGALVNTVKVSEDNRWAAYLAKESEADEEADLMLMKLNGTNQAVLVAENVLDFGFLSENGALGYFCKDENGIGVLRIHGGSEIYDVEEITFAEDMNRVYYIRNLGVGDGAGMMQHWDGNGEPVTVDGGVSSYQYEGFGRLQLLYHYDVQEQTFDLGYYDGDGVFMLDEGVNAIY